MSKDSFLTAEKHFDALIKTLPEDQLEQYHGMRHVRVEECFDKRTFIVYEMADRGPVLLDHLVVVDFYCDHEFGATTIIANQAKQEIEVGYKPVRLWDYDVFVFLPLHLKFRWSTTHKKIGQGSLAWQMCLRTKSRLHMREADVTYCETGVNFAREFESPKN